MIPIVKTIRPASPIRTWILFAWILVGLRTSAGAASLTPVTMQLDWVVNAQFAGLVIAQEKGFYEAAGLDVTLQPIDQKEMDAVAPVVRGEKPIILGCADGTFLLRAKAGGAPVKAFGTMLQASPLGIVSLSSSAISGIKDLVGKRIGLHAYNREQLGIMLASAGIPLESVQVVELGDDSDSLLTGKVDAQVCYLIDEPVAMELKGATLKAIPGFENGYVSYSQVYFATSALISREPDLLKRFLDASNLGWKYAFAHPDESAEIIVRRYMPEGDVRYLAGSLKKLKTPAIAETGLEGIGKMKRSTWETSVKSAGLPAGTATGPLLDDLLDFSVLRAIYGTSE